MSCLEVRHVKEAGGAGGGGGQWAMEPKGLLEVAGSVFCMPLPAPLGKPQPQFSGFPIHNPCRRAYIAHLITHHDHQQHPTIFHLAAVSTPLFPRNNSTEQAVMTMVAYLDQRCQAGIVQPRG